MIRLALIASLTAFLPMAPAFAQDDPEYQDNNAGMQIGTRFSRAPETAEAGEARYMQKRVANCVWNRNEDDVRDILVNSNFYQIDFDSIPYESETMFDELEVSFCMGRLMRGANNRTYQMYMQIPWSTLRNLLAEEAYLADYDGPPQVTPALAQDVAGRFDGQRVHRQVSVMAGMADCMSYNAPSASHELLRARPGSSQEDEVIDVLGPVVAACANSDEEELSIPTSLIRQMTADGLWSRSHYGSNTAGEVQAARAEQSDAGDGSETEERFASCVVDNDPDAARAILTASSQDEFIEAVTAVISICPVDGSIDSRSLNSALEAALGKETA